MRSPIDLIVSAIDQRLAQRIVAGDGPLAQALANRYSRSGTCTGLVDPGAVAVHVKPIHFDEHGVCDDLGAYIAKAREDLRMLDARTQPPTSA